MRRLPPLAIGGLAGLVLALLLAPATGAALGRLAEARAERARLALLADAPAAVAPPLVVPASAIEAPDAMAARRQLARRIRAAAGQGGLLVEELSLARAPVGLVAVKLRLSGPEKSVLALADALERGSPLVRLRGWALAPLPEGGIRLEGEAVAAWR
ncbi:hypothetical protein [Sphingosinithalassobacter sp. LHW66-3]|uniref:hypothetical protein n=1 Tax=Sphingosinithalassobacter sp. LHW66-3 TaxID=3424718 RepID=UPI003D6B0525